MTTPPTALPAALTYGQVRFVAVGISEDDNDAGNLPGAEQINGSMTFTPQSNGPIRYNPTGALNGVAILTRSYTFPIRNGVLQTQSGDVNIGLVANNAPDMSPSGWNYKVEWKLDDGYSFGSFFFALTAGSTVDLVEVMPQADPVTGVLYLQGPPGPPGVGTGGAGIPPGGTTGQVLAKTSSTDYAVGWVPQTGGGSSVVPATETAQGILELATQAEATAGTDTIRAITPATLKAVVDAASTADRARANHTGTQSLDTTTDSATRLAMTAAERTKLGGIATGATVNSTDATLLARANHTGTQDVTTIANLTETVQDIVAAFIAAGIGVTTSYDDAANTYTINASGGGGGTTDPEIVRDVMGSAIVAGAGIQVTVNDAGDTITISSTAVLPTRTISTTAPLTGGGDLSANRTLGVSAATDIAAGVVELATDAETVTGTDTTRAVTPASLHNKVASATTIGIVRLATTVEAVAGTDTVKVITPAGAAAVSVEDRKRSNHTGTQLASTISDFSNAAKDAVGSAVFAGGPGVEVNYDTTLRQLSISNTYQQTIANAPPYSIFTVVKDSVTGFWPTSYDANGAPVYTGGSASAGVRPTSRTDITIEWEGADPSPASVDSGTGGMLRGRDRREIPNA